MMTGTTQLTYGGVFLAVLAEQLCLPVPATIALIMAGALAADGKMHLPLILLAGISGCLCGDGVWFWLGRHWGPQITRLICRFSRNPFQCSESAKSKFTKFGEPLLAVAKFFPGLNGIMPPLAGAEGTAVLNFLGFDGLGALLWTTLYVALGYLFSHEVNFIFQLIRQFGLSLIALLILMVVGYASWRGFLLIRMIRLLRLRRITARMLHRKLNSNTHVLLLDLREFERGHRGIDEELIPGAIRVNPERLRASPRVVIPDGIDTVLYCSSKSDALSARVALTLKRRGLEKVWILEDGIQAWQAAGLPLATDAEVPEVILNRLGIHLPEEVLAQDRSRHVHPS